MQRVQMRSGRCPKHQDSLITEDKSTQTTKVTKIHSGTQSSNINDEHYIKQYPLFSREKCDKNTEWEMYTAYFLQKDEDGKLAPENNEQDQI